MDNTIRTMKEIIQDNKAAKKKALKQAQALKKKQAGTQYTFNIESGASVTINLGAEGVSHA